MPNVRAQICGELFDKAPSALPGDDRGVYIQSSDGREFVVTKRMLVERFQSETGSRDQKRAKVLAHIRSRITQELGDRKPERASLDFADDGDPLSLVIS